MTEIFDMQTRPELVLLQKTMVVVEGVARRLDPEFDMWTTAEPVVRDWIERNLGATGRLEQAGDALGALARLAGQLPELARRAERLSQELDDDGERGHPARSGDGRRIGQRGRAPRPLGPRGALGDRARRLRRRGRGLLSFRC